MANQSLENVFNTCVDLLAEGATVQDCLDRFPQYADQLRPLLDVGASVRDLNLPTAEVMTAQAAVWEQVEAGLAGGGAASPWWSQPWLMAVAALIVLTVAVVIGVNLNDEPPVATPGDEVTFTPIATDTLQATASSTAEPSLTATDQSTNTPPPTSTSTRAPSDTPQPTATSTRAPSDTPQPTATSTRAPSDTPQPTITPEPTNTAQPALTTITGTITEIDDDDAELELLNSFEVIITADTILPARTLVVGDQVEVSGTRNGLEIVAVEIVLLTPPTPIPQAPQPQPNDPPPRSDDDGNNDDGDDDDHDDDDHDDDNHDDDSDDDD